MLPLSETRCSSDNSDSSIYSKLRQPLVQRSLQDLARYANLKNREKPIEVSALTITTAAIALADPEQLVEQNAADGILNRASTLLKAWDPEVLDTDTWSQNIVAVLLELTIAITQVTGENISKYKFVFTAYNFEIQLTFTATPRSRRCSSRKIETSLATCGSSAPEDYLANTEPLHPSSESGTNQATDL